ncbi:MAG TPA: SMP-30/gluconolactonase/LRE family protein [Jatrophihabitans sp.]|jgi:sugar lactone lactonase YvrE
MKTVSAGGYRLAEGARWVAGRLVFVDILDGRLYEVVDGHTRLLADLDVPLGAVAPVEGSPGRWICAAGTGIALLDADGRLDWLARLEDDAPQPRRMNDGVCDPSGRFWAGSMAYDETPGAGSLYRTDADGSVTRVLDSITITNGPAFTADGRRMYVADSAAGWIHEFDIDPASGEILDRREFTVIDDANPDGMIVDLEGRLWNAVWGGSAVRCYAPDATLLREIEVPARQPTSVCLADGQLFVTTARDGLSDPAETEGAVVSLPVDAQAPPATAYRPA